MTKYYKNGFYDAPIKRGVEITETYWQDLLKAQANGMIIETNENNYPILKTPTDSRTYKEKRLAHYPEIGDLIDAFIKARDGDNTELRTLCALRQSIKEKYPKD